MAAAKSLQGQLLLDAGDLGGSFFARGVVLVCQHNADGAFGLVLNRDSGRLFADAISAELPERLRGHPVFLGGPVQPAAMSYLVSDDFLPGANVMPNLHLGHSLEDLIELGNSFSTAQKLRTFAGYSGWGPGQLEGELKRRSWLVMPAALDIVFDPEPALLWNRLIRKLGGWRNVALSHLPPDPSQN